MEEDFRESDTLPGHGGPGGPAHPRGDRCGTGADDDGGTRNEDGGDRPAAPQRWSAHWARCGSLARRCPTHRCRRPRVRCAASQIGIRGTIALGFSLRGRPARPAQPVNTPPADLSLGPATDGTGRSRRRVSLFSKEAEKRSLRSKAGQSVCVTYFLESLSIYLF